MPRLLDEFQAGPIDGPTTSMDDVGHELAALDGQNRADLRLDQLDDVLALDPAAPVIASVDFDAIGPRIEKARAAGVPVMIFGRQVISVESDLTSVAGTIEIGQLATREVSRLLEEENGAVEGLVLPVPRDPGGPDTPGIQRGFEEAMAERPEVEVLTRAAMHRQDSNAGSIVRDRRLTNPDLDVVFVHAAHRAAAAVLEVRARSPANWSWCHRTARRSGSARSARAGSGSRSSSRCTLRPRRSPCSPTRSWRARRRSPAATT